MAEVQKNTNSSESTAQFVEFVMMQAQNASLFLGLIPHPGNGQPEVNLPLARMFIDQLAMIQEKTRGNLSSEEANVLRNALSNLQMAYVEVVQEQGGAPAAQAKAPELTPIEPTPTTPPASVAPPASAPPPPEAGEESRESKKRFTKSYGS